MSKIEFRLLTKDGRSMKVKVPGQTNVARLKEKLLPTLRSLNAHETWIASGIRMEDEGGREIEDTLTANDIADTNVLAYMRTGNAPSVQGTPKKPALKKSSTRPMVGALSKVPHNHNSSRGSRKSSPTRSNVTAPTGGGGGGGAASSAASTTEERCIITVHFVGASDPESSHINFRLNPKKITFWKLKRLVEDNAGRAADRLLFRRSDGRDMAAEDHRTLESVGIVSDTHIDCVEDVLHPPAAPPALQAKQEVKSVVAGAVVHLVLESVSGERLPVAVAVDATIASLAKSVDDAWGIPAHLAGVVWLGRTLSHQDTVRDCGLVDGASLQIISRANTRTNQKGVCTQCSSAQQSSPFCPVTGRQHPMFFAEGETTLLQIKSGVDGKEYRFPDIRVTATVHKVKVLLQKATGIPIAQQVISVDGREIADGFSIKDGGLVDAQPLAALHLRPGEANFPFVSPPAYFFNAPATSAPYAAPPMSLAAPPPPPPPSNVMRGSPQRTYQQYTSTVHGAQLPSALAAVLPPPHSPSVAGESVREEIFATSGVGLGLTPVKGGVGGVGGVGVHAAVLGPATPKLYGEKALAAHVKDSMSPYRVRDASWMERSILNTHPESPIHSDELERRTLERMEAARRSDLKLRQGRGMVWRCHPPISPLLRLVTDNESDKVTKGHLINLSFVLTLCFQFCKLKMNLIFFVLFGNFMNFFYTKPQQNVEYRPLTDGIGLQDGSVYSGSVRRGGANSVAGHPHNTTVVETTTTTTHRDRGPRGAGGGVGSPPLPTSRNKYNDLYESLVDGREGRDRDHIGGAEGRGGSPTYSARMEEVAESDYGSVSGHSWRR